MASCCLLEELHVLSLHMPSHVKGEMVKTKMDISLLQIINDVNLSTIVDRLQIIQLPLLLTANTHKAGCLCMLCSVLQCACSLEPQAMDSPGDTTSSTATIMFNHP